MAFNAHAAVTVYQAKHDSNYHNLTTTFTGTDIPANGMATIEVSNFGSCSISAIDYGGLAMTSSTKHDPMLIDAQKQYIWIVTSTVPVSTPTVTFTSNCANANTSDVINISYSNTLDAEYYLACQGSANPNNCTVTSTNTGDLHMVYSESGANSLISDQTTLSQTSSTISDTGNNDYVFTGSNNSVGTSTFGVKSNNNNISMWLTLKDTGSGGGGGCVFCEGSVTPAISLFSDTTFDLNNRALDTIMPYYNHSQWNVTSNQSTQQRIMVKVSTNSDMSSPFLTYYSAGFFTTSTYPHYIIPAAFDPAVTTSTQYYQRATLQSLLYVTNPPTLVDVATSSIYTFIVNSSGDGLVGNAGLAKYMHDLCVNTLPANTTSTWYGDVLVFATCPNSSSTVVTEVGKQIDTLKGLFPFNLISSYYQGIKYGVASSSVATTTLNFNIPGRGTFGVLSPTLLEDLAGKPMKDQIFDVISYIIWILSGAYVLKFVL